MENKVKLQKSVIDDTLIRIEEIRQVGGINLPKDYSVQNAIQAAGLVLAEIVDKNKKPVLEVCTKASIANSLFYMVTQGLNPLKNQCYFIAYGTKLVCQRSYEGSITLAKRFSKVKDVFAHAIFEGDVFEYAVNLETGMKQLVKHEQKIENVDMNKIKGAYALVIREDGVKDLEVMTMPDIKKAWLMRSGNGLTDAHKDFPDRMAEKTVIKRACKKYIDSTSDAILLSETSDDIEVIDDKKEKPNSMILLENDEQMQLPPNVKPGVPEQKEAAKPEPVKKENGKTKKAEETKDIPETPNF
jgi:recombination protein RecT